MKEHSITFGADAGLVGTIAVPEAMGAGRAGLGFLLFNAGVVQRVGPHRINVRLARQLAARGIPSIRFDLAGHGDSARLTGQHSFEAQAVVDIRAAMDALGSAVNIDRFAIFGLCSGAYHGYAAALVDERVAGLLMFDAYRYPTLKTHAYHYLKALRQPLVPRRVYRKLRRGVLGLGRSLRRIGSRASAEQPVAELGRINFVPSKSDFAAGLKLLLDRGVKIAMVYSSGDIRLYNYRAQFRDAFARFGIAERIPVAFWPDVSHGASALADQAELMRLILAFGVDLHAEWAQARIRSA